MKNLIAISIAGTLISLCGCFSNQKPASPVDEYIEMLKSFENSEITTSPSMCWEIKHDFRVIYTSAKFASFRCESYEYSGGAHGMPNTIVGSIRNGRIVKLADLPDQNRIKNLFQQALKAHPEFQTIRKYAKFSGKDPQITENFYLDDKGIHFIYQPYEIAPFSSGTIDIFIAYRLEQ